MEEMSISERASYNVQTREEFAILKKDIGSLVTSHFKEHNVAICRVDSFNSYLKSAEVMIEFYYNALRGDKLEELFFHMRKMDLTINSWFITWDKRMIEIRFSWR